MSIWSSNHRHLVVLNGDRPGDPYTMEGTPTCTVDVATATGFHDGIRLCLWDDPTDAEVYLTPTDAQTLITMLTESIRYATQPSL